MEDIEHYDIPVYNFPYDVEEDDEETIQDNSELRVKNFNARSLVALLISNRHYFPLLLLDLKRKSTLMDNLFAPGYTLGVSLKLTIQSTRISAGFEVPF